MIINKVTVFSAVLGAVVAAIAVYQLKKRTSGIVDD
jgi:hypothetical protein